MSRTRSPGSIPTRGGVHSLAALKSLPFPDGSGSLALDRRHAGLATVSSTCCMMRRVVMVSPACM